MRTSGTLLHVSCACWPYPSFRIVYAIACCWLKFAWGHYKKGLQILTTLSNTVTGRGIGHKCSHFLKPSLHYFFELCLYWSSLRGICCFCVLCYSFAHSLTPCLSFCIISPKKKLCPPMWWPHKCYTLAAHMPSVRKLCCLAAPAWYAIVRTCSFIVFNCFH